MAEPSRPKPFNPEEALRIHLEGSEAPCDVADLEALNLASRIADEAALEVKAANARHQVAAVEWETVLSGLLHRHNRIIWAAKREHDRAQAGTPEKP